MGEEVSFGAGLPGAVANTVAFDEGQPWLDELLVALPADRGRLDRLLAEHLWPVVRWQPEDVQATYLVRLDCSPLGLDDPAGLFERRGRVAFEPRSLFGPTLAVAAPHAPLLLLVPAGLVDSRHTAASLVLPNGQSNGKSDGGDWSDRTRRASAGSGVLALSCALTRSAWPGGVATRRDLRTGCRADIRGAARRRRRFGRGRPSR